MSIYRFLLVALLFLAAFPAGYTQQVSVNTVGKDPFTGKATEIIYKVAEGEWSFAPYPNGVVKASFRPADYTRNEQLTEAVLATVQAQPVKITATAAKTIELDNAVSVVIQRDKLYFKSGREVKVKGAGYFAQGDQRGFRFLLGDEEKFFGGGERALPMDRRGYRLNLYNTPAYDYGLGTDNMNFSVPFLISSAGYGLFFDNPSRGYLDIGLTDKQTLEAGFSSGALTFYVVMGRNIDEILLNYTSLTGRQPLPPRWALGQLLSRFGYRSEAQARDVVAKMRKDNFPMDGLILDLFWFGDEVKGTMGNLDWSSTGKWPDPKAMMTSFNKDNLHTLLITEPFIVEGSRTFAESKPYLAINAAQEPHLLPDFYFGKAGLVDIFKKDSRDWLWKFYKKQVGMGVGGWWSDLGEPETHPNTVLHNFKDKGVSRFLSADEVHNVYGHYWSKFLFEKYNTDVSDTRLFNLVRSGFAGSQRFSVFPWSGDVGRSWSGLKAQFPVLLGMSLSGLPYIHSDAGGFASAPQADPELYTRWLQFAAFTPIFRPHGTALEDYDPSLKSIPPEPTFWEEPNKSIVRQWLQLRYQLLPYNYTLGYEQSVYGKPLMRPLYYYNFTDPETFAANEQYFWGDQFLVAPVMTQGSSSRKVYLPEGGWYQFEDNAPLNGKQWVEQPAALGRMPLLVRAGSFIPVWQPDSLIRSTAGYDARKIGLLYYPSPLTTTYTLFDDDGSSTRTLEKADYELVSFSGTTAGGKIVIDIKTNNEALYKKKQVRQFTLQVPSTAAFRTVLVNGKAVKAGELREKPLSLANGKFATAVVEFNGKPTRVELGF
ncbi:MAG: glycoside hydrolase family 31 protein [Candidatus Pseudobacter hemicellulosilyticus]|uniref:Glycoside hydrolase family 31 protein n=1 Tax=Candidatus Pseudobacter hemicellulosilyticus TaxID=3121375 RepID=A0AAJ6BIG6_9BACT|nr:MAG: glycoside hydrolase family 31 protein [Pseudobacter sp.]